MKKSFNKKNLCLAAAALTLTAGLSVGSAMAYFTTYATASGFHNHYSGRGSGKYGKTNLCEKYRRL